MLLVVVVMAVVDRKGIVVAVRWVMVMAVVVVLVDTGGVHRCHCSR